MGRDSGERSGHETSGKKDNTLKEHNFRIDLTTAPSPGRGIFRFSGNPLVLVLAAIALFLIVSQGWLVLRCAADLYFPYQGRVVKVAEAGWFEWFAGEDGPNYYLTLATDDGGMTRRYIQTHALFAARIAPGDYVRKPKGFGTTPRADGKETLEELRKRVHGGTTH